MRHREADQLMWLLQVLRSISGRRDNPPHQKNTLFYIRTLRISLKLTGQACVPMIGAALVESTSAMLSRRGLGGVGAMSAIPPSITQSPNTRESDPGTHPTMAIPAKRSHSARSVHNSREGWLYACRDARSSLVPPTFLCSRPHASPPVFLFGQRHCPQKRSKFTRATPRHRGTSESIPKWLLKIRPPSQRNNSSSTPL